MIQKPASIASNSARYRASVGICGGVEARASAGVFVKFEGICAGYFWS
jgi:hypothetical protein